MPAYSFESDAQAPCAPPANPPPEIPVTDPPPPSLWHAELGIGGRAAGQEIMRLVGARLEPGRAVGRRRQHKPGRHAKGC